MDFKHNIIQWNCRGLKPKFDEIKLLLSQHKSSVLCLQETFLKRDDTITLKGFNVYNHIHSECQRSSGGPWRVPTTLSRSLGHTSHRGRY